MPIELGRYTAWIQTGAWLIGSVGIFFGIFTAFWPARSIALYQWIMAQINWRVEPIDKGREVRTTRLLGTLLILLSAGLLAALGIRKI